jgi:vacuolar-type H+-ATPase subunit I/STV1
MDLVIIGLVGLVALMMLALGVIPMFTPKKAVEKYHVKPDDIVGLNLLRSMIGGSFIANLVLIVLGLLTGQTIWFLAVAVYMGIVAIGRIIGIVVDGYHKEMLIPLVAEVVIVVIMVAAHNQSGTA